MALAAQENLKTKELHKEHRQLTSFPSRTWWEVPMSPVVSGMITSPVGSTTVCQVHVSGGRFGGAQDGSLDKLYLEIAVHNSFLLDSDFANVPSVM